MNYYFRVFRDGEETKVPALYIKCKYCNEDVGYLLIEKGGTNAQTDLLRMINDYNTRGVCMRCTNDHLDITKDPEMDRRFLNVESQRIVKPSDQ